MMTAFVLDTSVVMAWCFEDENNSYADAVLDHLKEDTALAPGIWPLEIGNVLVSAERRGRMTRAESEHFLELIQQLPIEVETPSSRRLFETVINLAREQSLSTYDAAYLDLAMRVGVRLATLDNAMQQAAIRFGIPTYLSEERKDIR
ncbi:MAG: type II toxin-antitoxin system VapC family toxin [Anaerolineaceae bacterium]|nr:type II toxin-antitoxin system VapC family toxin [Anaerolineaceae bacterium]